MKYTLQNGIHIVEVPVEDFKIEMCDEKKKAAAQKNYCNAGFFATYHEGGTAFTLPVAHLVCDFAASNKYTEKYCKERGTFVGDKFRFDSSNWSYMNSFCGKKVSTLAVSGKSVYIVDTASLPATADYAISGVPVMRSGADVKFDTYVRGQGWDSSSLYATWHVFLGLKRNDNTIYVIGMKTCSVNMIKTAEAYKKFKALGMWDVIKLDGGGSFHFNVDGKAKASTLENRRINTIITFGDETQTTATPSSAATNPYPVPCVTLKKGNIHYTSNRWLQWQLSAAGYPCAVDGKFGSGTLRMVEQFQEDNKLGKDGKVGPLTRTALINAVRG